ncbi:MAG: ATPase, T2SS/T4P/T4SS family [Mycobacteriales bacterium]
MAADDRWLGSRPVAGDRKRIGEVLVEQGLITSEQLTELLGRQNRPGTKRQRLGAAVIDAGYATDRQVAEALAAALALEVLDLSQAAVDTETARLLPRSVAERSAMLVLTKDGSRVTVATSDPTNVVALDDVRLHTDALEVVVRVATEAQVRHQLARVWSLSEDGSGVSTIFEGMSEEDTIEEATAEATEAAPVVKLVDVILADAVRARASDVHVEPQAGELRIRYRIDGLLRDVMTVPRSGALATISRIKIVSGLDIAERRRPQDGRARLLIDGSAVEARVSTLPTLHGEKVVIRVLPRAESVPRLDQTGITGTQLDTVTAALVQSQGLILITGPTGSGKTSTLYAAIQHVSTPDRNVVTLEDPVEIELAGITQVQVNNKAGMTFAAGLRSVLRQDPDIVLVGETRDQETAELALQASLTGHLVLTTLHTNDAVGAVTRLVDMGVEPFLVASSLSLVIAQRLLRKPCEQCQAPYAPSPRTLSLLGIADADLADATPLRGKGCGECGGTGYRGRTGIFEVLPVTAQLRHVLLTTPSEAAISAAARAHGMTTMRSSALQAAHRGETTYEEVLRATHVDDVAGPRCPTCARALADDMLCCPWDGTVVGANRCTNCERQLDGQWTTCPWCRAEAPTQPTPLALAAERLPRLLVIEDDLVTCQLVELALEGLAQVTSVHTAEEGLAIVGTDEFDGVLIDNQLPDLTGIEVIRLLRSDPGTLTMPLVMFTSSASTDLERDARRAGADDYLTKPVEPGLLEERVLGLIRSAAWRG